LLIAQTDAQSLDGQGLLTAGSLVEVNISEICINANILPFGIASEADDQVVIAATAAQRGASTGIAQSNRPAPLNMVLPVNLMF